MTAFDLFSIGHSNSPADRFMALLRDAGVDAMADVRSTPYSRFFPWFSRKNLEAHLAAEGVAYLPYGETLGGRPRDQSLYRDGIADDCHRCLLVARALAERGLTIGHILHDGTIEPHTATELRLMAWLADTTEGDLFVTGQNERLAAAYRCRARAVAYRAHA